MKGIKNYHYELKIANGKNSSIHSEFNNKKESSFLSELFPSIHSASAALLIIIMILEPLEMCVSLHIIQICTENMSNVFSQITKSSSGSDTMPSLHKKLLPFCFFCLLSLTAFTKIPYTKRQFSIIHSTFFSIAVNPVLWL
jgi:hypothetical protein